MAEVQLFMFGEGLERTLIWTACVNTTITVNMDKNMGEYSCNRTYKQQVSGFQWYSKALHK